MRWMFAGLIAVAGVAQAAPVELKLAPDAVYQHKPTGLSVPATLDGLPRVRAAALAGDQLDEFLEYRSPDDQEHISVYVYRLVVGSMPMWFDRTRWTIENRKDRYGDVTPLDRPVAFTPPGQSAESGLMRLYITGKGPSRSTAVAMMPLGDEWIVKFRYSSGTHSAEALAPRVAATLAQLGWPAKAVAQPVAAEIVECGTPITFTGKAKEVKPDGAAMLMQGLMPAMAAEARKKGESKSVTWCRDSAAQTPTQTSALYRADGATDSYVLAIGDAGRGISVMPDTLGQLVNKGALRWSVSFADMARVTNFFPYNRLPTPAQAIASVEAGRYTSSATTWGKGNTDININSSAMK